MVISNDIKKVAEIDLYEILNINPKDDLKKIKKNYKKLVLIYHPDKSNGDREVYELINLAYLILKNEKNRKLYDHERNIFLENNKTWECLKNDNRVSKIKLSKEDAEKEYYSQEKLLNEKHGFDSNNVKPICQSDMAKKLNELTFCRSTLINETKLKLGKKNISNIDFNNNFINDCEIENNSSNEIIAFNDSSNMSISKYNTIDNFDLYSSTTCNTSSYTSLDTAFNQKLPKNISNEYSNHNTINDFERGMQKDRLEEYNNLTNKFNSMKLNDFN